MTFGVTPAGFILKRLADIQAATALKWAEAFGEAFEQDPRTLAGQTKLIQDERLSVTWELGEDLYNSHTVNFSEGVSLDNVVQYVGLTRESAIKSVVDKGRARGVFGTVIAAGTIISVVGDTTARFITNELATIDIAAVDEVQKISFDADPDSGTFEMVFPEGPTGAINYNDSLVTIQGILDSVLGASNSVVTGAVDNATGLTITYAGTLAGLPRDEVLIDNNSLLIVAVPVILTPSTITEGEKAKSPIIVLTAETAGPLESLAGTLTNIVTPIIGLEEFTNEEDAIVGKNIETDAELKLRRTQEIQFPGAAVLEAIRADLLDIDFVTAALVFENDTDLFKPPGDPLGVPPHHLDIVVEGGDETEIAKRILATKAAGIGTFGAITKTVQDSQTFDHLIRFSRPTSVLIFIEIDLVVDTNFFPSGGVGEQQVEDAILAFGNALTISQDVVVKGTKPLTCSFQDILGITDYEIRISRDAGPPTLDDNIIIAPREVSDFDSSRVTVVVP